MKKEDVKIGLKVVPHSKKSGWYNDKTFEDYLRRPDSDCVDFFKHNGYLEVIAYDGWEDSFVLGGFGRFAGDFFLAEDFEPYEEETKEDKLTLLSETFSKIFDESIKLIDQSKSNECLSQRKLDRAENFYNSLRSTIIVMNSEIQACNDALPHLDGYDRVELEEEITTLQESINWTMDAFALSIADCLDIDLRNDDYINAFYDAITKKYGFDWMIEKLKKEELFNEGWICQRLEY